MKYIFTLMLFFAVTLNAEQGTIDTVYSFIPGSGSLKGSEPDNYPQNIFGPPSKNASLKVPENNANEILSIGLGGEIIVGFKNKKLMDVEGTDFTIFENAFETISGDNIFAEPAEISISNDGINYLTFLVDYETLENCAGKTPTLGDASPFDTENSGGDQFDISKLGFSYITT